MGGDTTKLDRGLQARNFRKPMNQAVEWDGERRSFKRLHRLNFLTTLGIQLVFVGDGMVRSCGDLDYMHIINDLRKL